MTNPMELIPAGRDVAQEEQDRWFKVPPRKLTWEKFQTSLTKVRAARRGFDPTTPLTHNQACVLKASNAICREQVPWWWGGSFAPVGLSRHWKSSIAREITG